MQCTLTPCPVLPPTTGALPVSLLHPPLSRQARTRKHPAGALRRTAMQGAFLSTCQPPLDRCAATLPSSSPPHHHPPPRRRPPALPRRLAQWLEWLWCRLGLTPHHYLVTTYMHAGHGLVKANDDYCAEVDRETAMDPSHRAVKGPNSWPVEDGTAMASSRGCCVTTPRMQA